MSGREWKPGDVALVLADVLEGQRRAVRRGGVWVYLDHEGYAIDAHIDDARPLVVIDPEDREQIAILHGIYARLVGDVPHALRLSAFHDALREFGNPKPPKPDEPTGLGAVVEDDIGNKFIRVGITLGDMHWRSAEPGDANAYAWQAVPAVRVLSEGVQP